MAAPLQERRVRVSDLALSLAGAISVLVAALALGGAAHFLAGTALTRLNAPIALAAAAGCLWFTAGRDRRTRALAVIGLLLGVAAACLIAGAFYDLSWDGQDYHQQAISSLAEGWNPIATPLAPDDFYRNIELNHYPKCAWIAAASILLVTGSMEAAKAPNLLLAAAAFLAALGFLLREERLRSSQAVALAALAALNPVVVCQLLTNYVDGLSASALTLLAVFFVEAMRRPRPVALSGLAAALIVALNLKFTCTVYAAILVACFALYAARSWREHRRLLATLAAGSLAAVLVVGYQPYVTNALRNGHPLYPLAGGSGFDAASITRNQAPADFMAQSRASKLLTSLFARSANDYSVSEVATKFPLAVSAEELRAFRDPDVRFGGFGPLFGAAFLVALCALVAAALADRHSALGGCLLALVVFATAWTNPEPWWARYSPQLWFVPLVALALAWVSSSRRLRVLGTTLAMIAVLDAGAVAAVSVVSNIRATRRVSRTLEKLASRGDEVLVFVGPLHSSERLLKEHGIRFRLAERQDELPCREPLTPGTFYAPRDCQAGSP